MSEKQMFACNCNGITLFISVDTHTRYPSLSIQIRPESSDLITLLLFDMNWPLQIRTVKSPLERAKRDMIILYYEKLTISTPKHLIYNCNISIYFYGVTSS